MSDVDISTLNDSPESINESARYVFSELKPAIRNLELSLEAKISETATYLLVSLEEEISRQIKALGDELRTAINSKADAADLAEIQGGLSTKADSSELVPLATALERLGQAHQVLSEAAAEIISKYEADNELREQLVDGLESLGIVSSNVERISDSVVALAAKLDAEDVVDIDTDYEETVSDIINGV